MKIAHWTAFNASGMNAVAETMAKAERAIGLDSTTTNCWQGDHSDHIDKNRNADVHFCHTYLPEWFKKALYPKQLKTVWLGHGTPEVVFNEAVQSGDCKQGARHGISDPLMIQQYYLQTSDAIVTHWPRHAAIYRTMVDRNTVVHEVPMGIDLDFWKPVPSRGKFAGEPSLIYAENGYQIKWPYDILIAWPWVYPRIPTEVALHVTRLEQDKHRWFFPLANRNGSAYACHLSNILWNDEEWRNTLCSVDYQIGLVSKGDFNRVSLEANACGIRTISYRGNPYSDFWLDEGDQRIIADQLVDILLGRVEPRKKTLVSSAIDTAKLMKEIYQSIL